MYTVNTVFTAFKSSNTLMIKPNRQDKIYLLNNMTLDPHTGTPYWDPLTKHKPQSEKPRLPMQGAYLSQ